MLRSLSRLLVVALVGLGLASACGSDDSKKTRRAGNEDAGAGGEVAMPSGGGSKSMAGQPARPEGGGGAGSEPMVAGGQGGQTPHPLLVGGQAGNEPVAAAGAAGMSGAAGAAGAPPDGACCQPITCAEAFPVAEGKWGYIADDGCGHYNVECGCPVGTSWQDDYTCTACQPDTEYCIGHCGDTVDNCGNPVSCPDNCVESICYEGSCCNPITFCEGGCGLQDDGCGGTIDCGNNCDGGDCVNGSCCIPVTDACIGVACGQVWDNCGYVDCGTSCEGTTACIDQTCQESVCKANGFNCGEVQNPLAAATEGIESCGDCPDNQACVDNVCLPICGVALAAR